MVKKTKSKSRKAARKPGAEKKEKIARGTKARIDSSLIEVKIGRRLKHARLVNKLRLRELANLLGCSESFLSKVENDKVRPSLSMLHRIVGILKTNIATLFAEEEGDSPVKIMRANNRPVIRTDPILHGPGIGLERLVAGRQGALIEANIHCVDAGGHTDGVIEHDGEEIGFVLQGQLDLRIEGVSYKLNAGDCFFFRSTLKHGYMNPGKTLTKVLWVCTPPTF